MLNSQRYVKSLYDLVGGLGKWRIWARLAWVGVLENYRRSVLGPFWITMSTLVMVLTFGVLYGKLFNRDLSEHLPYVAVSLIIWLFYSEILVKGCHVFISNGRMIQQLSLNLSIYLYQLVTREIINLLHNLIIIVVAFLIFLKPLSMQSFLSLVGFLLITINATAMALIFGIISIRFRDFPPIIMAGMRPMMFLTPIIWSADVFPDRAAFVFLNPFYHIVEVFRGPLLGTPVSPGSWVIVVVLTFLSVFAALVLFSMYRHRIAFWV